MVTKLARNLSLRSVVAIGLGAMLGPGLFVLPGLAAERAGASMWIAFVVAAATVLPAALSKSELATSMPAAGGPYVYVERTFGPLAGTVAGVGLWLTLLLKCAFALDGIGAYLSVLVDVPMQFVALGLLAAVTAVNVLGAGNVGRAQEVLVGAAVGGLALLMALAAWRGFGASVAPTSRPFVPLVDLVGTVALVSISYAGLTKVGAIAEEVRHPGRNLPRGILLSLLAVTVVYGTVTYVLGRVVPLERLAGNLRPLHTMALHTGGAIAGFGAVVLAVVTMVSMVNAGLLAASRFPFAMARDRLLPAALGAVHARHATPVMAIVLTAAAVAAVIVTLDVATIAKLASSFLLIVFATMNVTVVVLREGAGAWYRPPFRTPLYPWTQGAGILVSVVLLVALGPMAALACAAVVVPGVVAWALYGRHQTDRLGLVGRRGRRPDLARAPVPVVPEPDLPAPGQTAVVVALFGYERSPEMLVEMAVPLAADGRIEIVYLREVPEQTALEAMTDEDAHIRSVRRRLSAMSEQRGLALQIDVVVTHDLAQSVHALTSRLACQWLVMAAHHRSELGIAALHPLGWLGHQLPCNVALFRDAGVRYVRDILAYVEPGPHDALVVRTATTIADAHGAALTLAGFVPDGAAPIALQTQVDYLEQLATLAQRQAAIRVLRGTRLDTELRRHSATTDLLVMGAPAAPRWWHALLPPRVDQAVRRAACSVLRLQTPRQKARVALHEQSGLHAVVRERAFRLTHHLQPGCIGAQLAPLPKEALFRLFAEHFAAVLSGADADAIERALWNRERAQNTAIGMGVALPHATVEQASHPLLGVYATRAPVDYGAPDGQPVDVFFVTIGPASQRAVHLELLAALARLILQTRLLDEVRAARSASAILEALTRNEQDGGTERAPR